MKIATDLRVGNVIRIEGKICRIITQELRGAGKFGKTVHMKVKSVEDGGVMEKSLRAEDKAEDIDVQHVKMQYLYKDGEDLIFMNMSTFEQLPIPAKSVGKQIVFLKENDEIDVLFGDGRALMLNFPQTAELKVVSAPPGVKGGGDSTYKEVELENGLKVLVPQFVKEGESIRIQIEDLSYLDRVTTKSLLRKVPDKA